MEIENGHVGFLGYNDGYIWIFMDNIVIMVND